MNPYQEIWAQIIDRKVSKNSFFFFVKIKKRCKFGEILSFFPIFMVCIFFAEISNNFCFCKLDESLRNFCSLQFFVFVTVLKTFGFQK